MLLIHPSLPSSPSPAPAAAARAWKQRLCDRVLDARTITTLAGAALLAATPWHAASAVAGVAVIGAGWLVQRHHAKALQAARQPSQTAQEELKELIEQLLPLWRLHIERSREQMETAVTDLTQRFARIVERLDQAMQASSLAAQTGG